MLHSISPIRDSARDAQGLGAVRQTHQNGIAKRDGILVALSLEVYRRRHGSWPKTLNELSPDLLPTVPRDRFTGLA